MSFLLRLTINALGLWVATQVVPGVTYTGGLGPFLVVALIFGVINATLRPLMKLMTCPLILLTLGLFALIVNGAMFWLTGRIASGFGLGFQVDGFQAAFLGALVVSVISALLSWSVRVETSGGRRD
ncbi:MAG: phage holin family protein [Vicinamibacterales bacterium]